MKKYLFVALSILTGLMMHSMPSFGIGQQGWDHAEWGKDGYWFRAPAAVLPERSTDSDLLHIKNSDSNTYLSKAVSEKCGRASEETCLGFSLRMSKKGEAFTLDGKGTDVNVDEIELLASVVNKKTKDFSIQKIKIPSEIASAIKAELSQAVSVKNEEDLLDVLLPSVYRIPTSGSATTGSQSALGIKVQDQETGEIFEVPGIKVQDQETGEIFDIPGIKASRGSSEKRVGPTSYGVYYDPDQDMMVPEGDDNAVYLPVKRSKEGKWKLSHAMRQLRPMVTTITPKSIMGEGDDVIKTDPIMPD